ncbi:MAG: effector-associated domain EAD1-containing protein, partial [Chloroflexota bacterium]
MKYDAASHLVYDALEVKTSEWINHNFMNSLPSTEFSRLQAALLHAFPNYSALQRMIRLQLEENLAAIAGGDNLNDTIFQLIEWAESTGRLHELINGAGNTNPNNPVLQEFIDGWAKNNSQSLQLNATTSPQPAWGKYRLLLVLVIAITVIPITIFFFLQLQSTSPSSNHPSATITAVVNTSKPIVQVTETAVPKHEPYCTDDRQCVLIAQFDPPESTLSKEIRRKIQTEFSSDQLLRSDNFN